MARARMLSKTLGLSRRFNAIADTAGPLTEFTQLLYALMVPHTDDFGRMAGDPFTVKMTVLPASPRPLAEFTAALRLLHAVELIIVYEVDGNIWLQVNKFDEHQPGLKKRGESKLPAPPTGREIPGIFRQVPAVPEVPGISRQVTAFPDLPGISPSRARAELNLTELNRTKERRTVASPPDIPRHPVQNLKIITKIAHEVLTSHNGSHTAEPVTGADICDEIKTLCAERHIVYNTKTVRKALDSAEVQRKKARA